MDRDGRFVPNLKKEDFRVWEDGMNNRSRSFFVSRQNRFPCVDGSTPVTQRVFRLEDIQEAASTFVNQLRPDDRVM